MPYERVGTLQQFTAALSAAVSMRDVARVLFEQGLVSFGAKAMGIVWMMRPGRFDLVYGHGLSDAEFEQLDAAARAGERLPVRDAVLARRPVWLDSPEEIRDRYPVLEPLRAARGEWGCAVVPLVVGERCPGVIGFTFDRPRHLSDAERSFIEVMAQLAAQAFERARLYEAEQEARRDAEHVGRIQEHLLGVVGHDLRTPLGAVTMAAAALLRRGDLPEDARSLLERVSTSATRMTCIIRDLLDLSRSRHGQHMSLEPRPADVAEVVRRALLEFEESQEEGRIVVRTSGTAVARCDPDRVAQLVSNLVGNALRHGAGAPTEVEVRGEDGEVLLVVRNAGPPIPATVLPHVFEPFRRGHQAGAEGLGLGLFIVAEIAKAHGGTVQARSDERAGTEFCVRLPR